MSTYFGCEIQTVYSCLNRKNSPKDETEDVSKIVQIYVCKFQFLNPFRSTVN